MVGQSEEDSGNGGGVAFLAGGVVAMTMIGGPIWFNACDLLLAYIPMAWLGSYLAGQKQAHKP